MASTAALPASGPPMTPLLDRLSSLCRGQGDLGMMARLADLAQLISTDIATFEKSLPQLRTEPRDVERGAVHLLDAGGKRLRPICVALSARLGGGFDERALEVAIAAELIHAATLLHDDVVDLGDQRRGQAAARMIFGNAVSIFAGDWLLIDALRRVRKARVDGILDRLLDVIEEMIFAESLQLERRGRLDTTEAQWFEVVEGKTAALFRWATYAGGKVGGLDESQCMALEQYGAHLGVAFQAIDDVLDLQGDPSLTGKELFADLREGKLTYPMIVARDRDPSLVALLEELSSSDTLNDKAVAEFIRILNDTQSIADCRQLAFERAEGAKASLSSLPEGRARDSLFTVADATVHRSL